MRTTLWYLAVLLAACASRPPSSTAPLRGEAPPSIATATGTAPVTLAPASASAITFERMSRWPEPGWQVPRAITFSADGKRLTFLQGEPGSDELALFAYDVATNHTRVLLSAGDLGKAEGQLSPEEELRRERQRQRARGISDYTRAARSEALVIPWAGDIYVREEGGQVVRLTRTPEPELDAKPCASGERVAYVRGRELFMTDVKTRRETQLSRGAVDGITRGQSDFNGQEEFDEPSGFFWSPHCDRIAYLEVDERKVEAVPIAGYRDGKPDVTPQRYPRAGKTNPRVLIKIVDVRTRQTMDVVPYGAGRPERYFARFVWVPNGSALLFQSLSRDQKLRELLLAETKTGKTRVIARETSTSWVEFREARPLAKSARALWLHNASGFQHLEIIDLTGAVPPRAVTRGELDVTALNGIDEDAERVFFTATKDGPLERHLYAAKLDGSDEPLRLTRDRGVHSITSAPNAKLMVDIHSSTSTPPRASVLGADGATLGELPVPLDDDFAALGLRPPEHFSVTGPSGEVLYGQLLKPADLQPGKRHPVVLMVYGGPGVQTVLDRYSARLTWQHLADRGVVVMQLDNRGTPGRGRAFERAIYGKLGQLELDDQRAALDYVAKLPFVDGSRVGIYGHSYGGYLTLLALLKTPSRFKVGVAGSPAIDFALYDSGYTERYLGTPQEHPDWYAASNPIPLASRLVDKLLVVHSLMDENVHFAGTAKLLDAFSAAGKPFDLLLFPGERHGYRSPAAKRYAWQRVLDYLVDNL
jgi:dipeptidyl-peptidase 4